jgi:DNA-directed RNA polymerase specialized sigma24 family protein
MPIQLEENLFLKYVYNPDYLKSAEIAKELGWPADKVHRTVCREKKKLEKE